MVVKIAKLADIIVIEEERSGTLDWSSDKCFGEITFEPRLVR